MNKICKECKWEKIPFNRTYCAPCARERENRSAASRRRVAYLTRRIRQVTSVITGYLQLRESYIREMHKLMRGRSGKIGGSGN